MPLMLFQSSLSTTEIWDGNASVFSMCIYCMFVFDSPTEYAGNNLY